MSDYDRWRTDASELSESEEDERKREAADDRLDLESLEDPMTPPYCQDCGIDIDENMTGYDDAASGPYVTSDGDLFCIPCGRKQQAAIDAEVEAYDDFDDCDTLASVGMSQNDFF